MVEDIIKDAMSQRYCISLNYGGGRRIVAPIRLGRSTVGNRILRVYQYSGYSRSGNVKGWKIIYLMAASGQYMLTQHFDEKTLFPALVRSSEDRWFALVDDAVDLAPPTPPAAPIPPTPPAGTPPGPPAAPVVPPLSQVSIAP